MDLPRSQDGFVPKIAGFVAAGLQHGAAGVEWIALIHETHEQRENAMKRSLIVVCSAAALLALGGCASIRSSGESASDVDADQVAKIESAARQAGVQVYWVNYPRKKTTN
jgi:hypothetical protein